MIVGVPREIYPGERRVALVPAAVPVLAKAGMEVLVEAGRARARVTPTRNTWRRARRSRRIARKCFAPRM